MKPFRTIVISLSLALGFAACASMTSQSQFDHRANFSAYKIYAWLPAYRWRQSWFQQRLSPIDDHIRQFVRDDLNSKGFREASGSKPEFWIVYYAGVDEPVDVATVDYKPWWESTPPPALGDGPYKLGTLVLDFIDAKSDTLIWRGFATNSLRSPDEDSTRVDQALTKLLADFPPNAASADQPPQ